MKDLLSLQEEGVVCVLHWMCVISPAGTGGMDGCNGKSRLSDIHVDVRVVLVEELKGRNRGMLGGER